MACLVAARKRDTVFMAKTLPSSLKGHDSGDQAVQVAGEMPVDNELEASDAVEAMEVCAHPYVCVFTIRLRLCIP